MDFLTLRTFFDIICFTDTSVKRKLVCLVHKPIDLHSSNYHVGAFFWSRRGFFCKTKILSPSLSAPPNTILLDFRWIIVILKKFSFLMETLSVNHSRDCVILHGLKQIPRLIVVSPVCPPRPQLWCAAAENAASGLAASASETTAGQRGRCVDRHSSASFYLQSR